MDPVWLIFLIWSSTQHYADFETQVLGITGRQSLDDDDLEGITQFLIHVVIKGCGVKRPAPLETPPEAIQAADR